MTKEIDDILEFLGPPTVFWVEATNWVSGNYILDASGGNQQNARAFRGRT
jgi:hypothetical protein